MNFGLFTRLTLPASPTPASLRSAYGSAVRWSWHHLASAEPLPSPKPPARPLVCSKPLPLALPELATHPSLPPQPRRSTAVPQPRPRLARPSPRQLRLSSPSSPSSRAYKRQARASSRAHLDHPEPPWPPLPVNSASPSSSHFRASSPRASPQNGFLSTY